MLVLVPLDPAGMAAGTRGDAASCAAGNARDIGGSVAEAAAAAAGAEAATAATGSVETAVGPSVPEPTDVFETSRSAAAAAAMGSADAAVGPLMLERADAFETFAYDTAGPVMSCLTGWSTGWNAVAEGVTAGVMTAVDATRGGTTKVVFELRMDTTGWATTSVVTFAARISLLAVTGTGADIMVVAATVATRDVLRRIFATGVRVAEVEIGRSEPSVTGGNLGVGRAIAFVALAASTLEIFGIVPAVAAASLLAVTADV